MVNTRNDKERLQSRLEWEGFTEIKMKSDGNCQFRALSHQLYKTTDYHKRVRKDIVQELKSRPKVYKRFFNDKYDFIRYVKNMSNDAEWGDNITLTAAANLYGVKIIVITSRDNEPFFEILPKSEEVPDTVIHLSYLDSIHYNSIHLNKGSDTAPMELQKKNKDKEKEKEEKLKEDKKEKEEMKKEKDNNNKKEKPTVKNYKKKLNRNFYFYDDMSMPLEGEDGDGEEEQEQEEKIPRHFQFSDFI